MEKDLENALRELAKAAKKCLRHLRTSDDVYAPQEPQPAKRIDAIRKAADDLEKKDNDIAELRAALNNVERLSEAK